MLELNASLAHGRAIDLLKYSLFEIECCSIHPPDKNIYRVSRKARRSHFRRYTGEVQWCTKIKNKENNRLLHASLATQYLSGMLYINTKRRKDKKYRRKDSLQEKVREEKQRMVTHRQGVFSHEENNRDPEEEGMTRSGDEIQEGSEQERKIE